jgi:hypothetical protein
MDRALIPPLTIALALVTAGTLLMTAAAIVPPPLTVAITAPGLAHDAIPSPRAASADAALVGTNTSTLVQTARAILPPAPTVVDLARLTYAPGMGGARRTLPGPLLLAVETGALEVQLGGPGQLVHADDPPAIVEGPFTLVAGDSLALPAATAAAFRNAGTVPAVALAAGVFPAEVAEGLVHGRDPLNHPDRVGWVADGSPEASVQPLAGGWLIDTPRGPVPLELRRMSLRPGESVPLTTSGAMALVVETGALTLVVGGGLVWLQHPDGGDAWIAPASDATLLPDDGALLQSRATATLRNAGSGPLLVLALTVAADEDGTS